MKLFHDNQYGTSAGLIYDDSPHYLDHLAPFCAQQKVSLLVCEPAIAELARKYYPTLHVLEKDFWELELPSCLISCEPFLLLQQTFELTNKKLFWLPHGHSDKAWDASIFQGEVGLVYGEKMSQRGGFSSEIRVGNFRYHYFREHEAFYKKWSERFRGRKNILYAPTWDQSNSFWDAFPILAETLNPTYQLLVRLHPNTYRRFAPEIEVLKGRYRDVVFLEDFPPVYPILSVTDVYLGDVSSIGYDFLTFNRPMLFLANPQGLRGCGRQIEPGEINEALQESQEECRERRALVYREVFG